MENISKLTPILYEKNETNFNHNGLGKLTKLLVNEIDEVLNGEFEALFEYPANGRLADKIDNEMFIKAKPNKKDDPHVFKIYDYELDTFTQTYLIYARSKNIEDLKNNVILDVNVRNLAPTQAWNLAKNNALDPVVTTFYSDITTASSVHWERRSLLSTIAGEEGSMIQYWGGEIKHDINRISLLRRRGQDNVTTVRHGKNLDGLKATYSTKGLVTAIVPYYVKNDDKTVYGDVVESQYIKNYPSTYYDIIEYNDEELGLSREDEPENGWADSTIKTALNRVAKRYFNENVGKDLPSINMEIALEDISQTKEYEQFKDFEQIEIGDTITVYSKKFNVNINAKVRRVVYNGLTDKNELVEVGTARRSLYDDVRDDFKKVETELQEGIDHAMTSANGKNTNYYGTADPNEAGLAGQNNDSYFRTNGQLKELWIYRDGMWYLEVGDLTGEQIRAEVEQAQADITEAQATADEAVGQIDTAVANAGFTSLDETISSVQSISNQAQINASTAIDNALEAMTQASQAVDNTGSLNIRVDEVENTLSVKADKQTVDDLTGVVDSQALDIQANAQGLALKANQDTVDTLAGTVQSLGTEFDVVAGQISKRVWNTDIETAIDGIEVGGRNLIRNSDFSDTNSFNGWTSSYGKHEITDEGYLKEYTSSNSAMRIEKRFYLEETGTFTFSIFAKTTEKLEWSNHEGLIASKKEEVVIDDEFKVYHFTFKNEEAGQKKIRGYQRDVPVGTQILIKWEKLEKGTIPTDWTPAPEDTLARFDHIETEWTQTFDTFSQTVSNIDGRVTSQKQTLDGMESIVYDPETGLSSLNTQLADLVQVAVTGDELTGVVSILNDNINARVEKGDVINQINISDENILIQANKIMALGDVVVDGKLTITDEFIAPNAQIDGAKIADATIGSAKIASLDVDKISGNTSEFVKSSWNTATGGNVNVTGSGILTTDSNGSQVQIARGMVYVRNRVGNNLGQFGYITTPTGSTTHSVRVQTSWGTSFAITQVYNGSGDRLNTLWMSINDSGQATMTLQSQLQMNYEGIYFADNTRQEGGSVRRVDRTLRIIGPQGGSGNSVAIYGGIGGSDIKIGYSLQSYSNGSISNHMWATLDMHSSPIVNQSDERLKMNIVTDEVDSLEAIKKWRLAGFDWRDPEASKERQFSVIAQSAPEIAFENYDGYLSINSTKQLQMTTHAVQQLALREENTNKIASQALQATETNTQKIERLEKRIEELEGVA